MHWQPITIYKNWHDKGIVYIKDILYEDNQILSMDRLTEKYILNKVDIMMFQALKVNLSKWRKNPNNLRFLDKNYKIDFDSPLFKIRDSVMNVHKARSKDYYNMLIEQILESTSSVFYCEGLGLKDTERVLTSVEIYRVVTKETFLLAIQFKIVHNIIATNKQNFD